MPTPSVQKPVPVCIGCMCPVDLTSRQLDGSGLVVAGEVLCWDCRPNAMLYVQRIQVARAKAARRQAS